MAQIVNTVAGDKRLLLAGEELCRTMTIGTNWSRIRVGMRVSFRLSQTISTSGIFAFGICQGTANGVKSGNTTDFMGCLFGDVDTGSTMTFNAGPPAYVSVGNVKAFKRVGSTNTIASTTSATTYASAAPGTSRTIMMLDITKGSPNYVLQPLMANSAIKGQMNTDLGALMWSMENDVQTATSFIDGYLDINMAYSGAGLHDSINVYWNQTLWPVEISDVCFIKFR